MTTQLSTGDLVSTTWLNEVERRKPSGAPVATSQTATGTSYGDLATVGPAVTVTTGVSALVDLYGRLVNDGANATLMSFAVSGASTVGAADGFAIEVTGTDAMRLGALFLVTGLTPGSNTFTAKYRVSAGTGTFSDRKIVVIAFD